MPEPTPQIPIVENVATVVAHSDGLIHELSIVEGSTSIPNILVANLNAKTPDGEWDPRAQTVQIRLIDSFATTKPDPDHPGQTLPDKPAVTTAAQLTALIFNAIVDANDPVAKAYGVGGLSV